MTSSARRPCLAWPFTIATQASDTASDDAVWLIAGEDMRYTLRGKGTAQWLPGLLERCDGSRTVAEILSDVPGDSRDQAGQLIEQLYGERVLIESGALAAHTRTPGQGPSDLAGDIAIEVTGSGELADRVRAVMARDASDSAMHVRILVQDRLDYAAALDCNEHCLEQAVPWMWLTTGPMARAYASPLFLPDAGPCLACLLYAFERLSPVPAIYQVLVSHVRSGGEVAAVPFPGPGQVILAELARWKICLIGQEPAPAPLYDLHVIDAESLEIARHIVLADPECPVCTGYRSGSGQTPRTSRQPGEATT